MIDEITNPGEGLGAMEFFILALIDRAGLNSLYLFQKRAGLQPGGIRPALRRLEELNLVQRAESARRQKKAISITAAGKEVLNEAWRSCLYDSSDAETALRAVCVALLMRQSDVAECFVASVNSRRQDAAREKELEAEQLHQVQKDPLSLYMWMRALNEARRRAAEGEAFATLLEYLEGKHDASGTPELQP